MRTLLRWKAGRLAAAVSIVLAGCSLPREAAAPAAQRAGQGRPPNIIVILADDIGREVLQSYGGTSYRTPNLDRMAGDGIRFARGYATPLCTPTRVQLMTGKLNFRNYEEFEYLNPRERTFGNLLKEAGYATAIAGKWQLGGDEQTPHGFGFDEYLLWQLHEPDHNARYKDPILSRGGGTGAARTDTLRGGYGPDLFQEFVEDFISRNREKPFFIYYPTPLVHAPFQPTPGHPEYASHQVNATNDTAYFGGMVSHLDGQIGRLMRKLDEVGVRENTLVLFMGDNGTHRRITSRLGSTLVQGGKGLPIDAGTHVPFIASWKGVISPGQVHDEMVDVVDVLPTLLDVAGVRPGAGFFSDGISFAPTLRTGAAHARRWIFNDYDPGKEGSDPPARWAHDKRYKLYSDGRFFDYLQDPLEKTPLARERLAPDARQALERLQEVMTRFESEIRANPRPGRPSRG